MVRYRYRTRSDYVRHVSHRSALCILLLPRRLRRYCQPLESRPPAQVRQDAQTNSNLCTSWPGSISRLFVLPDENDLPLRVGYLMLVSDHGRCGPRPGLDRVGRDCHWLSNVYRLWTTACERMVGISHRPMHTYQCVVNELLDACQTPELPLSFEFGSKFRMFGLAFRRCAFSRCDLRVSHPTPLSYTRSQCL